MHPSSPGPHPTQHKGHQRHPPTLLPPGRGKASPTPHPPCNPTHHATPPIAEKHHDNHARSEHRKLHRGQPTQTPERKLILRFRVAATHAQTASTTNTGHVIPPTIGKTTRQARKNPHTTTKQDGREKAYQRHGSKKLRTKCPKQPPRPARHQPERS